jgi:hypothetical protein
MKSASRKNASDFIQPNRSTNEFLKLTFLNLWGRFISAAAGVMRESNSGASVKALLIVPGGVRL